MKLRSFPAFILFFWVLFLFQSTFLQAQSISDIVYPEQEKGWIHFKPQTNLTPTEIINNYPTLFSLGPNDQLIKQGTDYDEIGFVHHRYQIHHFDIPVEHAVVYLHQLNGKVIRANGFMPKVDISTRQTTITPQVAIQKALDHLDAETYLWEVPMADSLALALDVPGGSFFPQAELIYTDSDYKWETEDYLLAYKMEIMTLSPHGSFWVYVDALNGEIIKDLNTLQHTDSHGVAETKFHGTQPIVTDSFENGFRLREYSRAANGIETYNLNNGTDITQGVDFIDSDNYWDTTNAQWDEVATDVHWGMEMAYDYFMQTYGRDSYDGLGGKILSFVHYDFPGSSTAFWNVYYAGFGDNNGLPHVAIDVVGHEVTHGIIRNAAGNLIYIDEGGALNEGYADIFGNALQYHVQPDSFDWRMGEKTGAVRNLANPGSFQNPDTYKGANWYTGDQDNGGAHNNANVLGHWFYLLSEGGSGVNDNGNSYQVTGIGIEKAAAIAYRNLTTYLTPTSQFSDARIGMIQSAEDLFGVCSQEAVQTIHAWYAVGLGTLPKDDDLVILEVKSTGDCQLSAAEPITFTVFNQGCTPIPAGDIQMVYFVKDPANTVLETFNFPNGIGGMEKIDMTFNGLADFSQPRDYEVFVKNLYANDSDKSNDDSPTLFIHSRAPVHESYFSFEGNGSPEDTFHLSAGDNASISISNEAGNNSGFGILMEGSWGFDYRLVETFPLWGGPQVDVFDFNKDFDAQACLCVDATNLVSLNLQFDLRQTYSKFFAVRFQDQFGSAKDSMMRLNANNLRLTVNGDELARYQAQTQDSDTFTTHFFNLDNYLGQSLDLCYQGRMIWDKAQDFEGIGDRIFIDNIQLSSVVSDIKDDLSAKVSIFPNPSSGQFIIEFTEAIKEKTEVKVVDLLGRTISHKTIDHPDSSRIITLDISNHAKGFYWILISQGDRQVSKSVIKE